MIHACAGDVSRLRACMNHVAVRHNCCWESILGHLIKPLLSSCNVAGLGARQEQCAVHWLVQGNVSILEFGEHTLSAINVTIASTLVHLWLKLSVPWVLLGSLWFDCI